MCSMGVLYSVINSNTIQLVKSLLVVSLMEKLICQCNMFHVHSKIWSTVLVKAFSIFMFYICATRILNYALLCDVF